MKISVNDQELFSLSEIQKKVIKNDVNADIFNDDMNRRLQYILSHKYNQCFSRLKEEWDKKLILNGVESVPTCPDKYAELVFAQPNYKCKKARECSEGQLSQGE